MRKTNVGYSSFKSLILSRDDIWQAFCLLEISFLSINNQLFDEKIADIHIKLKLLLKAHFSSVFIGKFYQQAKVLGTCSYSPSIPSYSQLPQGPNPILVHPCSTEIQIQTYKYTKTNTHIQKHKYKYKYTHTNTQKQIHTYKYTNINTKYK